MKNQIRRILKKFGYDIIKIDKPRSNNSSRIYQVPVSKFSIAMPGNNPLVNHYKHFPEYNKELGKLAKLIHTKYTDAVLIDIGANVGDTLAVIKSCTDIPVIAIEGDNLSYSFLLKNAQLFNSINTIQAFLGERDKHENVNVEKEGWNTTLIPSDSGSSSLHIQTLDKLLIDHGQFDRAIRLIKIDTEGFDTIILRGASKTLTRHHPVLFFEYNRENMDAIREDGLSTILSLTKFGYTDIAIFDNFSRCLVHTTLDQDKLLHQIHNYADGINGLIPHYDICIVHSDDKDIIEEFLK